MKRYNICVPKKYFSNNEEKTQWNNVGSLVYFPQNGDRSEGYAMELHMFPGTTFKVFEQKDRDPNQQGRPQQRQTPPPQAEHNQEPPEYEDVVDFGQEMNPDDIPF